MQTIPRNSRVPIPLVEFVNDKIWSLLENSNFQVQLMFKISIVTVVTISYMCSHLIPSMARNLTVHRWYFDGNLVVLSLGSELAKS